MAKPASVSVPQFCIQQLRRLAAPQTASAPEHIRNNARRAPALYAEDSSVPEMPAFPEFDELSGAFGGHIAASAEIPGKHRGRRAGRETIRKPDQTLSKLLTARSASVFMGRAACILKAVRARSARARKGKDLLRNPCKSEKPGKRRREITGKRFGVFVDSRGAAASPAESAGMTASEEVQYRRPQDGFSPVIALS